MPDREKIRAMTWLAVYEKQHENDVFRVYEHSKYDYIMSHAFVSFISFTLCYILVFGIYVVFNSDVFFYNINMDGISEMIRKVLVLYAILAALYMVVLVTAYSIRYRKAEKGAEAYTSRLKKFYRKYLRRKS